MKIDGKEVIQIQVYLKGKKAKDKITGETVVSILGDDVLVDDKYGVAFYLNDKENTVRVYEKGLGDKHENTKKV